MQNMVPLSTRIEEKLR